MEKNIRQLAAVMFTDMVGYTALMQTDEHKAKKNRDRHRKVLEKSIRDYHGLILQYYGDGTLSVFGSAIEAIECAVEIQRELQKEPEIPLRIGLHIGDIVYSDDGVYGDAVNIASRIENKSIPGGILISDKVFGEIKNHPEFTAISLGKFDLKNVKQPIELYALTNEGLAVPSKRAIKSTGQAVSKSVAVLPFLNMSADQENDYFSDGITEEIINTLTKIEGLKVTARTSSFALKDKNLDVREVGKMLGVTSVLEGSVRKSGNKVRISAQLANSSDGFHIFSEIYDRDLQDIFAVQDEISSLIANKLKENFEKPLKGELAENPPTENLDAYELYLKGRYRICQDSEECAKYALKNFTKAIELEPDFALPYVEISHIYSNYAAFRVMDPKEAYDLAKEYALKAINIDQNLAESHLALAHISFINDWDMEQSYRSIKKAIQLNPGSAHARSLYSSYLTVNDRLEESLIEAKLAKSLDPLSTMPAYVLGTVYLASENYNEAIELFEQTLKELPFFQQVSILKAKSHLFNGEIDKAIEIFKNMPIGPNRTTIHWGALGYAYSKKGETDKVNDCFEKIKKNDRQGKVEFLNWNYALIYLALNDIDKMFEYLEKSLEEKVAILIFIRVDPMFKQFRNDKRFIALIDKTFGSATVLPT
jgi:TolB-like protein/Tfp pilus assembly protein PilF